MIHDHSIIAVVQARMGSTRLPGKVLLPLAYRPALWHIIKRLETVEGLDRIIIATSTDEEDDSIAHFVRWLEDPKVDLFRGAQDDVLSRFYEALEPHAPDYFVRVTGDSPLLCPDHLQAMMHHIIREGLDGVDGHREKTGLTLGFGTEVYTFEALKVAHWEARQGRDREHVSLYIRERPESFKMGYVTPAPGLCTPYRLTLDYPEDYALLNFVYEELYRDSEILSCRDVVQYLSRHPALALMNVGCAQNLV